MLTSGGTTLPACSASQASHIMTSPRPIAQTLVNTIAKLLSAIVAGDIVHLMEVHQLLLAHHFGGRLGRTTSNSLHVLVDTIKAAWRCKQVISVLFLDIEDAFPNAVMEQLLHNLRTHHIPETYVQLIHRMLTGCRNRLKFDDHVSEWFSLDDRIVQPGRQNCSAWMTELFKATPSQWFCTSITMRT